MPNAPVSVTYDDVNGVPTAVATATPMPVFLTATGGALVPAVSNMNADAVAATTVAIATRSFGFVFNGTTFDRNRKPNQYHRLLSAAGTTNGTSVKAAAGDLHMIQCNVAAAADKFLKLYNKASAPVVGTDTPVLTITLPASTKNFQLALNASYFSAGIAYAITGAQPDADTTALTAGDVTGLNMTFA